MARQLTPAQLSRLPVTNEATIGDEYLDSNQHMNVSWYLHLFNRATGGMYRWLDFEWSQIRDTGGSTFVLEGHICYLAEVLVGEQITVRTRLIAQSPKRIHYLHFMINESKQSLAAMYEEVQAHIDMEARRMAPYPAQISQRFEEALAQHEALDWDPPVCGIMQV